MSRSQVFWKHFGVSLRSGRAVQADKKTKKAVIGGLVSTLDCCVTGLDKISPLVGRFGLSILVSTRLRGELKGDSFIKKDLRVRQSSEKSMYVIPFKCFFLLIIKFQLDVENVFANK